MIFFRVSANINIKTTDGTLVSYSKLKGPSNLNNPTVYITTSRDYEGLKHAFKNVDDKKYKARLLKESLIRNLPDFPIELGISNEYEHKLGEKLKEGFEEKFFNYEEELRSFINNTDKVDIYKQLKVKKESISLAIIGSLGESISQMIASSAALRILHKKLKEVYKEVKIDIFLEASNNSFYSRDKQIYLKQKSINKIYPLSLSSQKLCRYDYFIDNSSQPLKGAFYQELNIVDAWLYKFGFDYEKIPAYEKFNELDISEIKLTKALEEKMGEIKSKGKVLLYHPYSANIKKSIPQAYALEILKKLLKKFDDYIIVSTLKIDAKFRDDRLVDLSGHSKSLNDFIYIVSQMDKVVSANTSTFHIADAFMIPTVAIFTSDDSALQTKYYRWVRSIEVKDKSKKMSKFIFDNEELTFYKFSSWQEFKVSKIRKLLDKI